jgi:hypothetical protein
MNYAKSDFVGFVLCTVVLAYSCIKTKCFMLEHVCHIILKIAHVQKENMQ